jgi:hypothetical protein
MRSWKGKMPDVEVVEWEAMGNSILARIRQPAWGDDSDWYQVLQVRDDRIAGLKDYATRRAAVLGGWTTVAPNNPDAQ